MNATHIKLLGLLGIQAVLGMVTWNSSGQATGPQGAVALVSGSVGDVTRLKVTSKPTDDAEAKSLELVKKGDVWKVASAGDFPAKTDKVEDLIGKLLGLKVKDPLATSAANHNALRVGDRDYDKVVELTVGGKPARLVLGSAKGTSVHVRSGEDPKVYWANGLSTWAISDQVSGYVDTEYVKVKNALEARVSNKHGKFNLSKDKSGVWAVTPPDPTTAAKQDEITGFLTKLQAIRLAEPVGTEIKPEYGLADGVEVVLVTEEKPEGSAEDAKKERKETRYIIGAEVGDKFYMKADDRAYVVLVNKWSIEKILEKKVADFSKSPEPPKPPGGMPGMGGLPPGMRMPPGMMGGR